MTEQKFINRIKIKIAFAIVIVLAGVAILFLPKESLSHLVSGYRYGVAGGLFGAGIATIINNLVFLRNKEARQKEFISQTDERNILISKKSLGLSWFITLFVLIVAPIFTSEETARVLIAIMGISGLSYIIAYCIYHKTM